MSLDKIVLKNLIQTKITDIFPPDAVNFTGNPDKGIEAFADAIVTHLVNSGVSGSDSPALRYLDALGIYVGAPSGSTSPDYSSTIYITDGDNVIIAVGKLDAGLNLISSSFVEETLDRVTDRGNITDNSITIGGLDLTLHKITNVADPTSNQDVTTKKYVDDTVGAVTLDDVCENDAVTDVAITIQASGSIFNYLLIDNNLQVGGRVCSTEFRTFNSGSAALIFFDGQDGDFVGGDYGYVGQMSTGRMRYNIDVSSPEPYHSFTVQENEKVRIDTDGLDVTGTITASSSGSQFNTLTTINNLQVGGHLYVSSGSTLFIPGSVGESNPGIVFNSPGGILEGHNFYFDVPNDRFKLDNNTFINGELYVAANDMYVAAAYSSAVVDAAIYFGGGPSETLSWNHTDTRFEFSQNLQVTGWFKSTQDLMSNAMVYANASGNAASADATYNFCGTNTETLKWDFTDSRFEFSDDLSVGGSLKAGDGGTTNYCEIKDDGEINLHGTARVNRHVRIAAPSWKGGAQAPSEGFVGVVPVLEFDKTNDDSVHYSMIVPYRMASGSTMNVVVDWCYTGNQDNGTVCWGLEYITLASGSIVAGSTATITGTDGGVPTGQMMRTTLNTGITGAISHEVLGLRLYRDASADTLNTDANMIEVHFEFLTDKLGEAT